MPQKYTAVFPLYYSALCVVMMQLFRDTGNGSRFSV